MLAVLAVLAASTSSLLLLAPQLGRQPGDTERGNVHGLAAIHRVRTNSKHEDFCTKAPNRSHLSRAAQAGGRDNDRTGHRNYSTHELEQIPVSKLRETT